MRLTCTRLTQIDVGLDSELLQAAELSDDLDEVGTELRNASHPQDDL